MRGHQQLAGHLEWQRRIKLHRRRGMLKGLHTDEEPLVDSAVCSTHASTPEQGESAGHKQGLRFQWP